MSYFSDFASVYDEFTGNVSYPERAAYINRLLKNNGITGGILLDLACGTGSLSVLFADMGYDVIGTDSSPDMLSRAMEKNNGRNILYLCQDMRELDLYGTVDCAVCSLDSINHLLTEDDVKAAFENVSLFMRPGGVFVFDVNTEYKHRRILSGNAFVYENDDAFLVWQNSECTDDGIVDISIDIFADSGEDTYYRTCEDFSERAYSVGSLKKLLADTGFDVLSVTGDMSSEPPGDEEERIYITARKR